MFSFVRTERRSGPPCQNDLIVSGSRICNIEGPSWNTQNHRNHYKASCFSPFRAKTKTKTKTKPKMKTTPKITEPAILGEISHKKTKAYFCRIRSFREKERKVQKGLRSAESRKKFKRCEMCKK